MKQLFTTLMIIMVLSKSFVQAESTVSEEKNVLKINALSAIIMTGSIFYERQITDYISGQMGIGYLNYNFDKEVKFTGLFLTPECRFYLKQNAIDGMYIGPYVRYQKFSLTNKETSGEATYTNFGGGINFGRQWITDSGFTMDLFFGGHFAEGEIEVKSGDNSEDWGVATFEGFRPRIGFCIGFAF